MKNKSSRAKTMARPFPFLRLRSGQASGKGTGDGLKYKSIKIRPAKKNDDKMLLTLINALADYEKLKRPNRAACARLLRDAFGRKKRINVLFAFDGKQAVGYAIYFFTYSSFLALPTLYLEDLFVLPEYRKNKAGWKLFQACVAEAKKQGCGRMEWVVLDWNKLAIQFYQRAGARHLTEWLTYRLERKQLDSLIKPKRSEKK
jgi:GNAT superfamily N-acetyltransferase